MDLSGRLLVALPILVEDTFRRTVVALLHHDADGAFGVVLNRPSTALVADALPAWADQVAEPGVVFVGGPVQPELGIAIGPAGGAALATIDLEADPGLVAPGTIRIFAGYAGWSAGQLEGEIAAGAWAVVDAVPGDGFRSDPDELWSAVLARQPDPLRRLARLPDDLSVN